MDFLIGSIATLLSIFVFFKFYNKDQEAKQSFRINQSQSQIYELIKPAIPMLQILEKLKPVERQSSNFEKSRTVRVLVMGNDAYWIKDNVVYQAEFANDFIDTNSTKVVDIIHMDDVELKRMQFIIEQLTEGAEDDRSNPGNKNL